ncbi:MAG TPA: ABC transporter ATP-binding protein [Caldilineaceae bacterium]|nr:ABC transporter ATP-binding protein [Caldilineaceae bacterium]
MEPAKLRIVDVSMKYRTRRGLEVVAVDKLSLAVADREFASIVGPSGCGKSTLLRAVAGLIEPSTGQVLVDEQPIDGPGADRGMVFQSYTLFPWLTVQGNVEFGSKLRSMSVAQRQIVVKQYIDLVGLSGFERHYPKELSGGMMQRVAIARALANNPAVLLMDEPFGALDAQTRVIMQELLVDLWQRTPKTILFVTHDIDEAIFLSDRVHIMSARPGRIKQTLKVELPRPRQLELLTSSAFMDLKRTVLALIKEEGLKAIQQGA